MNPFWTQVIVETVLKHKKGKKKKEDYSSYSLAKGYRELKLIAKNQARSVILIAIGIISAGFGFKGFLLTNHFIDGGATGISLLLALAAKWPLQYIILGVNLPFIILAYRVVGKQFAIKTAIAILGLAACLAWIPFPNITNDNLLVAVFGGFFLGAGIGLAIRGGAVIDGTEVLAIFLSRKLSVTIGDVIILINIIIFSAAAYLLSMESALYSMITYLAASKTLDFIVEGIDEYMGVTIVSIRHNEIREMIAQKMGHGVTVYSGKKGLGRRGESGEVDILYTIVTRLELSRLNLEIEKIDPSAFVVVNSVKDTKGGMIKKRRLAH